MCDIIIITRVGNSGTIIHRLVNILATISLNVANWHMNNCKASLQYVVITHTK